MVTYSARPHRLAVFVGVCGALLVGCGQATAETSKQVIAHVGDQVVTTQELESEFRILNVPAERQKDPQVIKRVLGEVVVRKYLYEQAVAAKLDREPTILLDILRSREQVLDNAFLTRAAAAKAPDQAAIDKYISENPNKFADRKLLKIEKIGFAIPAGDDSALEANRNANSLDEIDRHLGEAKIPHVRQMGELNSAELSVDMSTAISNRKDTDVFFVRSGQSGVFFKVLDASPQPLSGDAAVNVARQLMRADALRSEVALAAYQANLKASYEGDYANIMKGAGRDEAVK